MVVSVYGRAVGYHLVTWEPYLLSAHTPALEATSRGSVNERFLPA